MELKDWVILISAVSVLLVNVIGAVFAGLALLAANDAKRHSAAAVQEVLAVKEDVHTVEVATNSMKDALIKATGQAAFAAGSAAERANPGAEHAPPEAPAEVSSVVQARSFVPPPEPPLPMH